MLIAHTDLIETIFLALLTLFLSFSVVSTD